MGPEGIVCTPDAEVDMTNRSGPKPRKIATPTPALAAHPPAQEMSDPPVLMEAAVSLLLDNPDSLSFRSQELDLGHVDDGAHDVDDPFGLWGYEMFAESDPYRLFLC
jgi:hypothetical protein